jgi:hypothetical protein
MRFFTLSSQEFNQNPNRAKRSALLGPVLIRDSGLPTHVLLSYKEFKRITEPTQSLCELLACDESEYNFESDRIKDWTTFEKY